MQARQQPSIQPLSENESKLTSVAPVTSSSDSIMIKGMRPTEPQQMSAITESNIHSDDDEPGFKFIRSWKYGANAEFAYFKDGEKPSGHAMYLLDQCDKKNLNYPEYRNSYVFDLNSKQLYYVRNKQIEDVNIHDMDIFVPLLKKAMEDEHSTYELRYLTSMQVFTLITSNGGHSPLQKLTTLSNTDSSPIETATHFKAQTQQTTSDKWSASFMQDLFTSKKSEKDSFVTSQNMHHKRSVSR